MKAQRLAVSFLVLLSTLTVPLVGSTQSPQASVLYVDQNVVGGANNGSSWQNAFTDLTAALQLAGPGDQIWVAQGTYTPGSLRASFFWLVDDLGVFGGFPTGGGDDSFEARSTTAYNTILSCEIGAAGDADNCYNVVDVSFRNASTILDGFAIEGGNANGSGELAKGGGIYNHGGSPTLRNLVIRYNKAEVGGGMYNEDAAPTLTNVDFEGNEAEWGAGLFNYNSPLTYAGGIIELQVGNYGGGMYNDLSDVTLTDLAFYANEAGYGGGMDNYNCSPRLEDIVFQGNEAIDKGGAIYNDQSHPRVEGTMFVGNSADLGGGIYNLNSSPAMTDTTFYFNGATDRGGALFQEAGQAVLVNASFWANTADYAGGAVNLDGGTANLLNSEFCLNTADFGGAVLAQNTSTASLTNSTFAANLADTAGGALAASGDSTMNIQDVTLSANRAQDQGGGLWLFSSTATVDNSILWDNNAAIASQVYTYSSNCTIGYSMVHGSGGSGGNWDKQLGTDAGGNIDTDPLLVAEPGPGADGNWGTMDDKCGDLRLKPDSPAIDAGSNDRLPPDFHDLDADGDKVGPLPFDMMANPRRVEVNGVPNTGQGAPPIVDMGAYEHPPFPIHVDRDAQGANTGRTWADAFVNLQSALRWAESGATDVHVAEGVYVPGSDRNQTLELQNGLRLLGGYPTGGGARDWQQNATVLSGEIGILGDPADNSYHVIRADAVDDTAVLDGFTISGGMADAAPLAIAQHTEGGALNAVGMVDAAEGRGGGLYSFSSSPTLRNLVFQDNYGGWGGGLYISGGSPLLDNVRFVENQGLEGGAIYNRYGTPTLINVSFLRNDADYGGGLYNTEESSMTLLNVLFQGNTGVYGGAVYNLDADIQADNMSLSGNDASSVGGGIRCTGESVLTLTNLTFSGNQAGKEGGGIHLSDCTIFVFNSILWSNQADTGPDVHVDNGLLYARYDLIKGGCPQPSNCSFVQDTNPMLLRKPVPGSDSIWGTADDDYGNLRPTSASPAVDAGSNGHVHPDSYDLDNDSNKTEPLPLDLAGYTRFVDSALAPDTGSGTAPIVDLGAYEVQIPAQSVYLPLVRR